MAKREKLWWHRSTDSYFAGENGVGESVIDVTNDERHARKAVFQGEWIGSSLLPRDLCAKGSEHGEQAALFAWAAACVSVGIEPRLAALFAIPNGGERSRVTAAQMKAEGVKAGVPDMFLPIPRHEHGALWLHGLFIELKRKDGGDGGSEKQHEWINNLRKQNYIVEICNGWLAARQLLIDYLEIVV